MISKKKKVRLFLSFLATFAVFVGMAMIVWQLRNIVPGSSDEELLFTAVPWGEPSSPHLIIISLDTTRADHFGFYGNEWIDTPNMDRLAKESIVFTDCMTVVPTTLASHTTLFTGKYPHHHGAARNGFFVNSDNVMLPEMFKEAGYKTLGFLASFALQSRFGFAQGFDFFDEDFGRNENGQPHNQRKAASVTNAVINKLETMSGNASLFLFVHFFDPHRPYTPPRSFGKMYSGNEKFISWLKQTQDPKYEERSSFKKATRYAGEISYMDLHLGRLVNYFDKRGILDNAILVITNDHGETFWEHRKRWNHGLQVYQTTMRSVLLMRLPNAKGAGTRVSDLIGNIDIAPTLLSTLGLPLPEGMDGQALSLNQYPIRVPSFTRFGQATQPWHNDVEPEGQWANINKARCVREGDFKYVQTPYLHLEDELYNVAEDPYEHNDLMRNPTPEVNSLAEKMKEKLERWALSPNPLPSHFIDKDKDETIERLKNLGYVEESP